MKNYIIFGILILTLLVAGCGATEIVTEKVVPAVDTEVEEKVAEDKLVAEVVTIENEVEIEPVKTTSTVKEFDMVAKQWQFDPPVITVNEGDTVKLSIKSLDVDHGFAISAFDVRTRLTGGQTTKVDFVADKKGEYTFFCSVSCGSGHSGMKGKLIVE